MSKSLIQTINQSTQNVTADGIISPGTVLRRFGCNCRLSGNAIDAIGDGYFEIDAAISVSPTEAGNVTVALYEDGVQIPGAISYGYASAASTPVTLPLVATIRHKCCCDTTSAITCVLLEGAGEVQNVSIRVVKS